MKLNVLLAKTDQLAASYKTLISEYGKFFAKSAASFKGFLKTYSPKEGTLDEPSKKGNLVVVTTVKEKLDWLNDSSRDYIDSLFSQEKTNATGVAKAELLVEGKSLGIYTTLELMRLKSLIEHQDIVNMYSALPVREDTKLWTKSEREEYRNREVYEDELVKTINKTTEKEDFIMEDPNIAKLPAGSSYTPKTSQRTFLKELGEGTSQNFSGETTMHNRAQILRRRTVLLTAVVAAIKEANDVEAVQSEMTADKLFTYLHTGDII